MARIRDRIRSQIAAGILTQAVSILPRLSNKTIAKLTDIAQAIMTSDDPCVREYITNIRNACRTDHPSIGFFRRAATQLNPKCRKMLVRNLFVNALFYGRTRCESYAAQEGLRPPFLLVLSPTMRCNISCVGCSTRRYAKDDDMPISLITRILKEAREMGIFFIVTQGGEMFVYEEMLEVYRKHPDLYFQVYTNGTLIDEKMAKTLARLGNVAPMISLDGFRDTTDRRRGKGVFDKAMRAMDNLKREGVLYGASITHTRRNSDEILSDEFYTMLLDKGCFMVWFFQFLPIGKDPDIDLMPLPEQRNALREKNEDIRQKLPLFIGDFWNDGRLADGCIAAGRRYLHINNKGDVEPCAFAHFAVDNIKNTTLKEALNSDFFKMLRSKMPFGNGNMLTPCMIIDNPEILRDAIKATGARPTHEGADVILEGRVREGLDDYSRKLHALVDPVWERSKPPVAK